MTIARKKKSSKQAPPIQFRPGVELEQLVRGFASKYDLKMNECCKALITLAVTELDIRFYPFVREMADAIGGANSFVRCCVYLRTAWQTAIRLHSTVHISEEQRIEFIVSTVAAFLAERGLAIRSPNPWADTTFGPSESATPANEKTTGRTLYPNIVDEARRQLGY